ncbi:hypothetical protein ACWPMX_14460 [Tsuneonella sp. HG094]
MLVPEMEPRLVIACALIAWIVVVIAALGTVLVRNRRPRLMNGRRI